MTLPVHYRKVIITGPMNVGKSTLVRRILRELDHDCPSGFYTRSILEEGQVSGYALCSWDGQWVQFARRRMDTKDVRSYAVDQYVFSRFATQLLRAGVQGSLCVLDELGVMEKDNLPFVEAVQRLFTAFVPVLAVIQQRALDHWLELLVTETCRVIHVERDTMDEVVADIVATMRENARLIRAEQFNSQ